MDMNTNWSQNSPIFNIFHHLSEFWVDLNMGNNVYQHLLDPCWMKTNPFSTVM